MREMKNSGVAWIGDIPENWKVLRNKNLIYEINEKCTDTTDLPLLSVSEYYGVAPRADKIHDGQIVSRAETFEGYKICHQDDVVMNIMLAWKRAQAVSSFNGIVSPAYCVYRKKNNSKLDMTFFNYLIRSDLYISVFKRFSTGIIDSRLRLYPEKFLALHSHVPPTYEQHKIAKHLNKACNNIENLINNQKQQIEKLKQYKQSLITEVVTKGLNPDVPMKDSGVKWIGQIPEEWNLTSVRYIGSLQNGISKSGEAFGTGYPFVCYGDIYKNYELPTMVAGLVETNEKEREQYSVEYGDVFFTRTSETIEEVGFSCVCKQTISNATFAGFVIRMRPYKADEKILTNFAKYYFRGSQIRAYLVKEMNLVTRASLGQTLLKGMSVTIPPKEEQQQIATYLDDKCAKIDRLIVIKQEKINKLNDYKKSLIYEYVTGKREVC